MNLFETHEEKRANREGGEAYARSDYTNPYRGRPQANAWERGCNYASNQAYYAANPVEAGEHEEEEAWGLKRESEP